ncbi:MAG: esterase-like activity of phytase family protein [Ferruginibacter sp.]
MKKISFHRFFYFFAVLCCLSCASVKQSTSLVNEIRSLKFINVYTIPFNLQYKNTTTGGLSGIDYDVKNNLYYLICDDRSDKNPARFYTAKIFLTEKGINSLVFTDVKYMLMPDGKTYPDSRQNRYQTPDPEAMRYNPTTNQLVWSSEGERSIKPKDTTLTNPAVTSINTNGGFIDSFFMPANMNMNATEKGPRQNGVFEGMTFADNYTSLFVSVEEPLYEDGPRADIIDKNSFIRILKFDIATRKNTAQYAYKLEPVAHTSTPENAFKINGVPDILSIGNNKLLVLERSFSTGRLPCTIKLFITELDTATDITNISLANNKNFRPVKKTLLLNMDELGIYTDNIEGLTFGPVLPNGHRTLLFISDNNFSPLQKTQLLLFEVLK